MRKRDNWEELDVAERIILKWVLEKWDRYAWAGHGSCTDRGRAFVNVVMSFRVP
jgi:hypothetical protein